MCRDARIIYRKLVRRQLSHNSTPSSVVPRNETSLPFKKIDFPFQVAPQRLHILSIQPE